MNSTFVNKKLTLGCWEFLIGIAATSIFLNQAVGAGLAPVDLLTTSRFDVLAESEITDVPASRITGDVGLSPAARSFITGLTQPEVVGSIYAASDGGATAVMLTQAQGDLTTAYNDAAGRTPVPTGPFLGCLNETVDNRRFR
jgi:Ice-binding-like